jgi:hypothetical protein
MTQELIDLGHAGHDRPPPPDRYVGAAVAPFALAVSIDRRVLSTAFDNSCVRESTTRIDGYGTLEQDDFRSNRPEI